VIGTLPDTQVEVGDRAMNQLYFLFDAPEGQASEVEVHPAAALATARGIAEAAAFWETCAAIDPEPGATLDAWHPVVALAAATQRVELEREDMGVALVWLVEHAERLGPQLVSTLGGAAAHQPTFSLADLVLIAEAAGRAGATELRRSCEQRFVDAQLDDLIAGRAWSGPTLTITDAEVLAKAGERCDDQLLDCDAPVVVAILGWAGGLGVPLSDGQLIGLGAGLLGPMFVDRSPSPAELDAVQHLPAVHDGIAAYAAERAREDPSVVLDAFDHGLGRLLGSGPVGAHEERVELELLSRARRQPERRVEVLEHLIGQKEARGESVSPLDPQLLEILWPDGLWPPSDAQRLLVVLSDVQVRSGEVPLWFGRAITAPRQRSQDHDRLCAAMDAHPGRAYLPEDAQRALNATNVVADQLDRLAQAPPEDLYFVVLNVLKQVQTAPSSVEATVAHALPPYLLAIRRQDLPEALRASTAPVLMAFLAYVKPEIQDPDPDLTLAAELFFVRRALWQKDDPSVIPFDEMLRSAFDTWRKRDLKKLVSELERHSVNGRVAFEKWFTEADSRRSRSEEADARPSGERKWRRGS
jgi:hypothetical protein